MWRDVAALSVDARCVHHSRNDGHSRANFFPVERNGELMSVVVQPDINLRLFPQNGAPELT